MHARRLFWRGAEQTEGRNGLCAKPERTALQFFISNDERYKDSLSRGIIGQGSTGAIREMYIVPGNGGFERRHQRKVWQIELNKHILVSDLRRRTLQDFVNVFDLQEGGITPREAVSTPGASGCCWVFAHLVQGSTRIICLIKIDLKHKYWQRRSDAVERQHAHYTVLPCV